MSLKKILDNVYIWKCATLQMKKEACMNIPKGMIYFNGMLVVFFYISITMTHTMKMILCILLH